MRSSGDPTGGTDGHPGRGLGLPVAGRGSVSGFGARLVGLVVDWVVCLLVVSAFVGGDVWSGGGIVQAAPLLVLFVEHTLLVGLLGTTIGHRVVGIRVVGIRVAGANQRPLGLARSAVRALLLCLAVPPLLMDRDARGLHDRAAQSVVVRDR